jgi:uracil-DNA glycosylase
MDSRPRSIGAIGGGWGEVLAARLGEIGRRELEDFLATAWTPGLLPVYPRPDQVFRAFEMTPLADVRAVILGQDPYPTEGQACGLAFSVPPGVGRPRSLGRILKELKREGFRAPADATLEPWTGSNGVLLANATLTYRKFDPDHSRAWRDFTRSVVETLVQRSEPIAFLLWGQAAQEWEKLIHSPHRSICSPHPMARGRAEPFVGSCPFRRANDFLGPERRINWDLM